VEQARKTQPGYWADQGRDSQNAMRFWVEQAFRPAWKIR